MLQGDLFSSTTTLIAAQWTGTAWVEPFISNLLVLVLASLAAFVAFTICEDFLYEFELCERHAERCFLAECAVVLFSFGGYLAWSGRAAQFWSGYIGCVVATYAGLIFQQLTRLAPALFFCLLLLVRLLVATASAVLFILSLHFLVSFGLYAAGAWLVISAEMLKVFCRAFRYLRFIQCGDTATWDKEAACVDLEELPSPDGPSRCLLQSLVELEEEALRAGGKSEAIAEQFEALLKRVQAEHQAVKVEKRAHEAILDAVLMWKEEKMERAGRRTE
ncbi:hypothetical protein JCM6882_007034 [Rhodosporidiobolus microsporus]